MKILIALCAAFALFESAAMIDIGDFDGCVCAYRVKRINDSTSSGNISGVSANEKAALAKAKTISGKKHVFPKDAKLSGAPIDPKVRIDSLCGYELGTIVKLPLHPNFDSSGNIIIEEKLRRPFRNCTLAELKYSKLNHALYSICIYSEADKKLDESAAEAQVDAMAEAIKAKFKNKIASVSRLKGSMTCNILLKTHSHQSIEICAYKKKIEKRGALKSPNAPRAEYGWAFSLTLNDNAMQHFDFKPADKPSAPSRADLDAL